MNNKRAPIAIIDIGSNSIRLVVYEKLSRNLTPLYNEKSSCALAEGVAQSGILRQKNIQKALKTMRRFALVIKLMKVKQAFCIATSAVREAKNGQHFVALVQKIINIDIEILSGEEEAKFAALGASSGLVDFVGIVGDLGGGSLELSLLEGVKTKINETFSLGVIRLKEEAGGDIKVAQQYLSRQLDNSKIIAKAKKQKYFCAIGGTWRAIAKLYQLLNNYPLKMVQDYRIKAKDLLQFCNEIVTQYERGKKYRGMEYVSEGRVFSLPFGALLLREIIKRNRFDHIIFSALGVREGYLFAKLSKKEQQKNALIEICKQYSNLRARDHKHSSELFAFADNFLNDLDFFQTKREKILLRAGAYLADIGWRGHPDYRAARSVDLIAFASLIGINHEERAFLALILYFRYMGVLHYNLDEPIFSLLEDEAIKSAKIIALIFRLAFHLSAGMAAILPKIKLRCLSKEIELFIPSDLAFLEGARLKKRLEQLAFELGLKNAQIIIS